MTHYSTSAVVLLAVAPPQQKKLFYQALNKQSKKQKRNSQLQRFSNQIQNPPYSSFLLLPATSTGGGKEGRSRSRSRLRFRVFSGILDRLLLRVLALDSTTCCRKEKVEAADSGLFGCWGRWSPWDARITVLLISNQFVLFDLIKGERNQLKAPIS